MPATKKIVFASVFILIFALIGFSVYFLILKPDSKESPKPLLASEPTVLWTDARTLSLLFTVENPNRNYASDNYSYTINLYDDRNNVIKSIQKSLFIYGGEIQTLAETKIDTGGNIVGRAEVAMGETNWIPAADFTQPAFKTESLETTKEKNGSYMVSIRLYNPNDFEISKVISSAVLFTKEGRELAVVRNDSDSMKVKRSKGLISYVKIDPSMEQYLDMSATKFYIYIKK